MTKQIFMTSDLHMGHDKIRGYCNRPFKTVEEMDETIIKNFNAKVKPNDTVYLLGDVSFHPDRYIDKLNGYKILVMGNHDHKKYNELYDEVYEACHFMKIGKYMCELNHYPYYYNNKVDFVICGHCLDETTEILTIAGWKNINNMKETDILISMDKNDKKLKKCNINNIIINDDQKELFEYNTRSAIGFSVTGKHRLFCKKYKTDEFCMYNTEELYEMKNNSFEMFISGYLDKFGVDITDDELRLIIWIITDGSIELTPSGSLQTVRFHLVKKRKINDLQKLLNIMNLDYSIRKEKKSVYGSYPYRIGLSIKKIKHLYYYFSHSKIKDDFKQLTHEQVQILIETFSKTDGTLYDNGYINLYTSIKDNADLLQYMCITSGHKCAILERNTIGYKNSKKSYQLSVNLNKQTNGISTKNIKKVNYNGRTWCVNCDLDTIIIRKNGKVLITGNCHELWKVKGNNVNIGVDQWDFEPVSINELEKFLDSLKGECVE